jgi:ADP-ribose pyrophosphatase YjhB (NUDIX family)/ribosomal protein S18 acetylase RimI-like enzyme
MSPVRFCAACGAPLSTAPPVTCAACGMQHWRNAKPCANAIVARDDGRILLTRRAHAPWRGRWCAPGGFCGHDEDPRDAAVREAREETGVAISVGDILGIWVEPYADDPSDADADWISVAYFTAEAVAEAGDPDPAEVSEQRWFAPDDLPVELAPPGTLEAVFETWARRRARAPRAAEPPPEAVTLRRAGPADIPFLVELYGDDEVDTFLSPRRARTRDDMLAEIERSRREPRAFGRMIIEAGGVRVGALGWQEVSERNRIAHLEALAVHPAFRGRRLADAAAREAQRMLLSELGYHRLELACYGFNERAIAHAERSGFVREGVKRKAYERDGTWQDAVLFALVREDLEVPPAE